MPMSTPEREAFDTLVSAHGLLMEMMEQQELNLERMESNLTDFAIWASRHKVAHGFVPPDDTPDDILEMVKGARLDD